MDNLIELAPEEFMDTTNEELVVAEPLPEPSRFFWDTKSTDILVKAYQKRRDKFLDPKCKKRVLWTEIKQEMRENGFIVDEDKLDHKMRNMKKTYRIITRKLKEGEYSYKWKYYDSFFQLFGEDPIGTGGLTNAREELSSSGTSLPQARSNSAAPKQKPLTKKDLMCKWLRVERRKLNATRGIQALLRETNSLMRERNELLKQFLQTSQPKNDESEEKDDS